MQVSRRLASPTVQTARAAVGAWDPSRRKLASWDDLPEAVQGAINDARNDANQWDYYKQLGPDNAVIGYWAIGKSFDPVTLDTRYLRMQIDPAGRMLNIDQGNSGPINI